jgi:hypothetical protein
LEAELGVMELVEQPALPKFTQPNPLPPAEQKYRREMLLQRESCNVYSEEKK